MASLIQIWRERWGYSRLSRRMASFSKNHILSLPPKKALILFQANNSESIKAMNSLLTLWGKKDIQVTTLAYYPDNQDHPEAQFSYFNQKALDHQGKPSGEVIDQIIRQPVDVLIRITASPVLPMDWIALQVPAAIKIASAKSVSCYGLQLDGHHDDLQGMVIQADRILDSLKKNAHVIA